MDKKIRNQKKKNTETGLLMGQNINVFSQLSATYLQNKSSVTEDQASFVSNTQIIQYHDAKINRLISLLRKKAEVTKAKAAVEFKEAILQMNAQNLQQFIPTFSHLFLQIVVNEQSKQVSDEFVAIINHLLLNHKKVTIKQIATIYGPFLILNRSMNIPNIKSFAQLFTGSDDQLTQKGIILLLKKQVSKKFIYLCKVILQCQEGNKMGQQNYQRNCSCLLKVIKDFIKGFQGLQVKKQQQEVAFSNFLQDIDEIINSKYTQQFMKFGGKGKGSLLQFYQCLVLVAVRHPKWGIMWEKYGKILCQNYLDKDPLVQQTMWKFCNRQFIQNCLQMERINQQKQCYVVFNKFLPKCDQKLLSCIKVGGASLYRELHNYCSIFPYTTFLQQHQNHKSLINKISFMRKLMSSVLEQQDQNQLRIEAYYNLCILFLQRLKDIEIFIHELDEKKQQQIRALSTKVSKQLINNLQSQYYENPPASRNSFTYYLPTYFCKILLQLQPDFDFVFDLNHTFSLYCSLKQETEFTQKLCDTIFINCKDKPKLELLYLENFASRDIEVDMTEDNQFVEQAAKIFLLSKQAEHEENWFKPEWDTRKQIIAFDPRITLQDLNAAQEQNSNKQLYTFTPIHKKFPNKKYENKNHNSIRFKFFLHCLKQQIEIIPFLLPYMKQQLLPSYKHQYINKFLSIFQQSVKQKEEKSWMVGKNEILRLRVITDIIIDSLSNQTIDKQINQPKLVIFLTNICQFVLLIYNYKLDDDAQNLLKLVSKLMYVDEVKNHVFESARTSIINAYQIFNRVGASKDWQDKQRKNRLMRLLSFVEKILWSAVDKKDKQFWHILIFDLIQNEGWKYSDSRPDLWLLGEVIINSMSEQAMKSICKVIVQQHQKYHSFIALILCCQMALPLQRHAETKKVYLQLQNSILISISQSLPQEQKLNLISEIINYASANKSFHILPSGVRTLLKHVLAHYQKIEQNVFQRYSQIVFEDQIQQLFTLEEQKENDQVFISKNLLIINLCSELPLLDLCNVIAVYEKLMKRALQANYLHSMGYFGILCVMWEAGVRINELSGETVQQIINKVLKGLSETGQIMQQKEGEKINFIKFACLQVLNSLYPVKGIQIWKNNEQQIKKQLIWSTKVYGSYLHGILQESRYKFLSRIFSQSDQSFKKQVSLQIPSQMLTQLQNYKQILDQMEEDDKEDTTLVHHDNIVSMFIEFAEILIRIAGGLNTDVCPKEDMVLNLLQCPFPGIKKTAFLLLKQMYELKLVEKQPPSCFQAYLTFDHTLMEYDLDSSIGNILTSYFYFWQAIIQRRSAIQQIQKGEQQQKQILTLQDYLHGNNFHEKFLKITFELLQQHLEYNKRESQYNLTSSELLQDQMILQSSNIYQKMYRIAMKTLFMFILNFPLYLRDFMDQNKKYKNLCDRILRNLISQAIFKEEVRRIQIREHQWKTQGNFQIYVTANAKEIYAEYTHDVIRIGLRLVMRNNYPLSPIVIQFGEGLKLDEGSRWALMLQSQLHSKNNTIINGILLWKQNIDKKLAGVEECSICFDIVNPTGQLPKKSCKTCKKKFHSNCIMKWFTKSNKSECPLCKSQFL